MLRNKIDKLFEAKFQAKDIVKQMATANKKVKLYLQNAKAKYTTIDARETDPERTIFGLYELSYLVTHVFGKKLKLPVTVYYDEYGMGIENKFEESIKDYDELNYQDFIDTVIDMGNG